MKSDDQINRTSALARMWATSVPKVRHDRAKTSVTRGLIDPHARDVAAQFLDRVLRPEDPRAAAQALPALAPQASFLGPIDRALLRVAGVLAPYVQSVAGSIARSRVAASFSHLVLETDDRTLTRYIAGTLARGFRLNLNLIGEPPTGERAARKRVRQLADLLKRPDVDYVSVDPTTLVAQVNPWDIDGEADRVTDRLRPLLRQAASSTPQKFVHLNLGRYRNLALTVEVFERLLSEDEFAHLSAGVTLQAYLPDSYEALDRLIDFATRRVQAGRAPLKVRIVKGSFLGEERDEAEVRGWVPAQYDSDVDVNAQFLDLIDRALRPEVAYALRMGVASNNLFHLAFAHLCAQERGVEAALDIEMLHGASFLADAEAIAATVANPVVILAPVVQPGHTDPTIPYLIRQLPELARLGEDDAERLLAQEEAFLAAAKRDPSREPRRSHKRAPITEEFASTPDSDPALAVTRNRMTSAIRAGLPPAPSAPDINPDAMVAATRSAAPTWASKPAQHRAAVLRTVAKELENRREQLITTLAYETGAVLTEADAQVSMAVDLARFYADSVIHMDNYIHREGLEFTPDALVLVTPSWSAPVVDAMNGVLGALAVGSAVILKPAPQTPRSAWIAMDAVNAALAAHGEPPELVELALQGEGEIGRNLVAHPGVDTVLLTGTYETARLFTSLRARHERGPRVFGETSGKNSMIVTPSADFAAAATQIVQSAFTHAGQRRSAASLLILVGSVATSTRFRDALVDAVESLRVEHASHPAAIVGPLVEPAEEDNLRTLTELGEGETWVVEPHQMDEDGALWSPGVKSGVKPGSEFHLTIRQVPVLGVMVAKDLEQAIAWHNATDFGLTAGIHSLDDHEIATWLATIEAANLYVNKPITDARPGRQPFGGWKNSSVGAGAKAGGPNFLYQLGQWKQKLPPNALGKVGPRVAGLLEQTSTWLTSDEKDWLDLAAQSDAYAREVYRTPVDAAGLRSETNACRYRPGPRMTIRAGENTRLVDVLRLTAAAWAAGVDAGVSVAPEVFDQLPEDVRREWHGLMGLAPAPADGEELADDDREDTGELASPPTRDGVPLGVDLSASAGGVVAGWRVEKTHEFTTRASTWIEPGRIRVLDSTETPIIAEAVSTAVAVLPGEALQDGRRELLVFLREQALSRTEHRYGHLPSGAGEGSPEASA